MDNAKLAEDIIDTLIQHGKDCSRLAHLIATAPHNEEREQWKKLIAQLMATQFVDVITPIVNRYPHLSSKLKP
jgi:hypothetical protein